MDYKTGTNGNAAWSYPHILGLDGAGVVVELGEGVEHLKIGTASFITETGPRKVHLLNSAR